MAEILFLAHRAPWPPDRGDRIRSWHLFEALCKIAPVHVAALADTHADAEIACAKMASLCASVRVEVRRRGRVAAMLLALARGEPASVAMFGNPELGRHVGGLLNHGAISHIVGFSSQMGQYIPPRDRFTGPIVMDFVDVDSAKFATYAQQDTSQPMNWVHAREARLLGAYEAALARRVDTSLFVSAAEASLFRMQSGLGQGDVRALDNGIDTDRFDPSGDFAPLAPTNGAMLTFTGQMDYRPNIDAVAWFAREILPIVQSRHPAATFAIVGRSPTREVQALAELPGVRVTGEVPDVRPWLAAADVVVAPMLLARGVQNKLLEAMAMARPVVASAAAAEGIDAAPGQHFHVANGNGDAAGFAQAVTALLDNPIAANAMGTAARERMVARYGWDAQMAPLAEMLKLA